MGESLQALPEIVADHVKGTKTPIWAYAPNEKPVSGFLEFNWVYLTVFKVDTYREWIEKRLRENCEKALQACSEKSISDTKAGDGHWPGGIT